MSQISEELRQRTKRYASGVIRLYAGVTRVARRLKFLDINYCGSGTSVRSSCPRGISRQIRCRILFQTGWTPSGSGRISTLVGIAARRLRDMRDNLTDDFTP